MSKGCRTGGKGQKTLQPRQRCPETAQSTATGPKPPCMRCNAFISYSIHLAISIHSPISVPLPILIHFPISMHFPLSMHFPISMHPPIQHILLFHRILLFQCVLSPAWYLCFSPPPGIQRGFPSRACCPVHPLAEAGPSHHPAFPPIFPCVGTARPQPLPASACVATARPGGWCLIFRRMTHGEMPASSVKNFKQRLFLKKESKKATICLGGNVLFSSLSAGEGTEGGKQSRARCWVLPTKCASPSFATPALARCVLMAQVVMTISL